MMAMMPSVYNAHTCIVLLFNFHFHVSLSRIDTFFKAFNTMVVHEFGKIVTLMTCFCVTFLVLTSDEYLLCDGLDE